MRDVEAEAVALLSDLVGIDSVNPALVPGAAGEADIVEHLRTRLQGAGFVTTVVPARDRADRPSLVAVPPGPTEWPTVVLNGHLDTVGTAGMPDPFTPRVDGDQLFGRGAADMKSGVAAVVAAAEHLVATGAPIRPVLALVADEEDASLGSESVGAALPGLGVRPDACLIAEPTDLVPSRSLRGFTVVKVTFRGRAAHSSRPELGVNAVTHLGRLLHAVDLRGGEVRAADLAGRLGDELGTAPTFDAPYWMEAPLWQQVCPTLVCGPSGGGLHAVDEWVDLGQVRAFASALVAVLAGWRPDAD